MILKMTKEQLKLRPLLKRGLAAIAHLHLKGQTQKQHILAHNVDIRDLFYS